MVLQLHQLINNTVQRTQAMKKQWREDHKQKHAIAPQISVGNEDMNDICYFYTLTYLLR